MADPPGQGDLVGLEPHAGAAPVAEPAPGQFIGDVVGPDRQPGGQTFDDDDQGTAVRLAGSQITQHAVTLPDRCRRSFSEWAWIECGVRGVVPCASEAEAATSGPLPATRSTSWHGISAFSSGGSWRTPGARPRCDSGVEGILTFARDP